MRIWGAMQSWDPARAVRAAIVDPMAKPDAGIHLAQRDEQVSLQQRRAWQLERFCRFEVRASSMYDLGLYGFAVLLHLLYVLGTLRMAPVIIQDRLRENK